MKTLHVVALVLTVVIVNNLLLLMFLSGKESDLEPRQPPLAVKTPKLDTDYKSVPEKFVESSRPSLAADKVNEIQSNGATEFLQQFRTVATSDGFREIMDDYQLQAQQRREKAEKRISRMGVNELYEIATGSQSRYERQIAKHKLVQGKLNSLGVYELKNLYQLDNSESYTNMKIIGVLLGKGDSEALSWAKELFQSPRTNRYLDDTIVSNVYLNDPEFIKSYMNNIDLTDMNAISSITSIVSEAPELGREFIRNNFDKLLDSENDYVYKLGSMGQEVELTSQQQERLLEAFDSGNRRKIGFAISFVNSIENVDALREAFYKVPLNQQKTNMVYMLVRDHKNPARVALGKQLIEESDDPQIKRFAEFSR